MLRWQGKAQRAPATRPSAVFGYGHLSGVLLCAALLLATLDATLRDSARFRWTDHLIGTVLLAWAITSALAAVSLAYVRLEEVLEAWLGNRLGPIKTAVGLALLRALLVASLLYPTAAYAFSGARISQTALSWVAPPLLALMLGALVSATSLLYRMVRRMAQQGQRRPARYFVGCALGAALGLSWADLTVYPFLYEPLHTLLEGLTMGLLGSVALLLTENLAQSRARAVGAWGALTATFLAAFLLPTGITDWVDERLAHTWLQELYVGRSVRRVQEFRAELSGFDHVDLARRAQLIERFDLDDTSLDPAWRTGRTLEPRAELRGIENIAVFYVDTLREDVTRVPGLMPRLQEFRKSALDFRNAYAVGSDTLRSLPAITSGTQFIQHDSPTDLLRLAEKSAVTSVLVSAKSAAMFLGKLRPEFAFEEVHTVSDADAGRQVWGYGANEPTATRIVDAALGVLDELEESERFFLWMFHFDQHAWRELDANYVEETAKRIGLDDDPEEIDLRYRAVAASVDEQFGRFLDGLQRSGRAENTAVLFVSDHGEGLGQEGFWVHSVFLWESLIHVPLSLKIPGVPGREVQEAVSLVDIAPTLAPILGGTAGIYHGEDLLEFASHPTSAKRRRRFPIILRSASSDRLSRVGVIDPRGGRKLVLRIRALFPELYALDDDPLDRRNLAEKEPGHVQELMRIIARSPAFPREDEDFSLLGSRGPLATSEARASLE